MKSFFRIPHESYKGRIIGCAPGTHAAVAEMVSRNLKAEDRSAVLDIGTHSGALLLRLKDDLGFLDLTGADLIPTVFDVPDADFKHLELNRPFSHLFEKKFQLVTATDVIEHLDSPRMFLTEIHSLLEEDGWLAISLPNVASWQGRIKFVLKGELWGFGEKNYRSQRHISPITGEQMVMMMQELGFSVVSKGSAGSFSTPYMKALTFPIWALASLLNGISPLGECAIFLARKTAPDENLKLPTHYEKLWKEIPDRIGLED